MATHLITGANGYVGFHILLDALKVGHRVRATVRNEERKQEILQNAYIKRLIADRGADALVILLVPDILDPHAYDASLVGGSITHILHTATPLPFPTENCRADIIDPSILGTVNLLQAAARVKSVRRVVLTSSLVANMPFPPTADVTTRAADRLPNPSEEEMNRPDLDLFSAYRYSKIAALNAADDFRSKETWVSFDIVNVFPGFIHGYNLLADSPDRLSKGSNHFMLDTWTGTQQPFPRLACAIHISDVAKVHLNALDEALVPYKSGVDIAATYPVVWDEAWPLIERHFPDAIKSGSFKKGDEPSLAANWDASETEKRFGMKFKPYETMVVDLAEQYLSLVKAQSAPSLGL